MSFSGHAVLRALDRHASVRPTPDVGFGHAHWEITTTPDPGLSGYEIEHARKVLLQAFGVPREATRLSEGSYAWPDRDDGETAEC